VIRSLSRLSGGARADVDHEVCEIRQVRDHLMAEQHLLDDYAGGLELRRFDR
jgi:hypothetical protein